MRSKEENGPSVYQTLRRTSLHMHDFPFSKGFIFTRTFNLFFFQFLLTPQFVRDYSCDRDHCTLRCVTGSRHGENGKGGSMKGSLTNEHEQRVKRSLHLIRECVASKRSPEQNTLQSINTDSFFARQVARED